MKTISDYSIYCTVEQTMRAFELGANIIKVEVDFNAVPTCYVDKSNDLYEVPTAEQMIGFILESSMGYSIDLANLIHEHGYKQGCLSFIDDCLK